MSDLTYDADAAIAYTPPADLPVDVLAVGYGDAIAVPDLVPVVEVTWQYRDRPGVFTDAMAKVGNWQAGIGALLRLRVFQLETVYATLGGWPPPTPLPGDYTAPADGAAVAE